MSRRDRLAALILPGVRLWRRLAPGGFRILLLHDVPPAQRPVLARILGDLAAAGRLIGPAEAETLLDGAAPPPGPPPLLVSFDDGFASNRIVAESILAPLGIRALLFVCPGLIELAPTEQAAAVAANVLRGQRPAPEPLLGWDDLAALAAAGHVIANHTLTHPRLAGLSPARLADEIGGGADLLARRLGPSAWFAFPFGDVGSIDSAALAEIGRHHRFCRSGVRGGNDATTPKLALRADHLDLAAAPAWQALTLAGGLDPAYRAARNRLDRL